MASWALVINGVLISLEGDPASRSGYRSEVFAALGQPVLVHGARRFPGPDPANGPWDDPPSRQVDDAGELTGPSSAIRSWWCRARQPPAPALKQARSSDAACRRLDIGPHGIPWFLTGSRRSGSSKRNCRIAQRMIIVSPRRALGHTPSGSAQRKS